MQRLSGLLVLLLAIVLVGALGVGAWQASDALVVSRTLSESRTVADMAENVGRWASQYGGVHVRTQGASAVMPGAFLTRSVYASTGDDAGVLQGSRTDDRLDERSAMERMEAYHWKNPALIQREVADVLSANGSRAQYRMTARTVLNENNAPNEFEQEALSALQTAFDHLPEAAPSAVGVAVTGTASAPSSAHEYWKVDGGQLLYARAVIAQKSCLRCHDKPESAPEFLRANRQFNGGGGYGYVVGKPVGLISVKLPVPSTYSLIRDGLPLQVWWALVVASLAALGIVVLTVSSLFRRIGVN